RPVALRTKRSRVLVAVPAAPPPTPNVAIGDPLYPGAAGYSHTCCQSGPIHLHPTHPHYLEQGRTLPVLRSFAERDRSYGSVGVPPVPASALGRAPRASIRVLRCLCTHLLSRGDQPRADCG